MDQPEMRMQRRCRPALGTLVEVAILDDAAAGTGSAAGHAAAFAAAFDAVARVDACMSFHRADSDLGRLNRQAFRSPVVVDRWTHDVLAIARRVHECSDGHFDCTIATTLVDAGLLPCPHPRFDLDLEAGRPATMEDVVLMDDRRVRYARPLALDLGGIAKGYAIDRAIDALRRHGVARAVVNAGGDLRVLGDTPVPIHVRGVDAHEPPTWAGHLADGAFATSVDHRGHGRADGRLRAPGALVRPHDRTLVRGRRRYSVVAPTGVLADALTKVVASAGPASAACLAAFGATSMVHDPRPVA